MRTSRNAGIKINATAERFYRFEPMNRYEDRLYLMICLGVRAVVMKIGGSHDNDPTIDFFINPLHIT